MPTPLPAAWVPESDVHGTDFPKIIIILVPILSQLPPIGNGNLGQVPTADVKFCLVSVHNFEEPAGFV